MTINLVNTTILNASTFNQWAVITNQLVERFNNLNTYDDINIIGGIIDDTSIGENTPSVGIFTNLSAVGTVDIRGASSLLFNDNQISGNVIDGGTISNARVLLSDLTPDTANDATPKQYVDNLITSNEQVSFMHALIIG
jgi:hypothetical protein